MFIEEYDIPLPQNLEKLRLKPLKSLCESKTNKCCTSQQTAYLTTVKLRSKDFVPPIDPTHASREQLTLPKQDASDE